MSVVTLGALGLIVRTLKNDAVLSQASPTGVGGRVYMDQAPVGAVSPFMVVAHVGTFPSAFGVDAEEPSDWYAEVLIDVKAVAVPGSDYAALANYVDRAQTLILALDGTNTGTTVWDITWEAGIQFPVRQEGAGEERHLGNTYRAFAQPS